VADHDRTTDGKHRRRRGSFLAVIAGTGLLATALAGAASGPVTAPATSPATTMSASATMTVMAPTGAAGLPITLTGTAAPSASATPTAAATATPTPTVPSGDRETLLAGGYVLQLLSPTSSGYTWEAPVGAATTFVKLPARMASNKSIVFNDSTPDTLKIVTPSVSGIGDKLILTCQLKGPPTARTLTCTFDKDVKDRSSAAWLVIEVADPVAKRIYQCPLDRHAKTEDRAEFGFDRSGARLVVAPAAFTYPWPELLIVSARDGTRWIEKPLVVGGGSAATFEWREGTAVVPIRVASKAAGSSVTSTIDMPTLGDIEQAAGMVYQTRQALAADSLSVTIELLKKQIASTQATIDSYDKRAAAATSTSLASSYRATSARYQTSLKDYQDQLADALARQAASPSGKAVVQLAEKEKFLQGLLEASARTAASHNPVQVIDPWGVPVIVWNLDFRLCDMDVLVNLRGRLTPSSPSTPTAPTKMPPGRIGSPSATSGPLFTPSPKTKSPSTGGAVTSSVWGPSPTATPALMSGPGPAPTFSPGPAATSSYSLSPVPAPSPLVVAGSAPPAVSTGNPVVDRLLKESQELAGRGDLQSAIDKLEEVKTYNKESWPRDLAERLSRLDTEWRKMGFYSTRLFAPDVDSPGAAIEPGQAVDSLTPTLRWSVVKGATSYVVRLTQYPYGPTNVVWNPRSVTGTSIEVLGGTLLPGKRYEWDVQACNSAGQLGPRSLSRYFQTAPASGPSAAVAVAPLLPVIPALPSPAATAPIATSPAVTSSALSENRAVQKLLDEAQALEKRDDFPTALEKLCEIKKYRKDLWPPDLENRFAILNDKVQALMFFGIVPAAPTVNSPGAANAPGSKIDSLTPTLRWSASTNATSYVVRIVKFPYETDYVVWNPRSVTATSIEVPRGTLQPDTRYRWDVQACNTTGVAGLYSNKGFFQTPPAGGPSATRTSTASP
jgi:hypothetical protein